MNGFLSSQNSLEFIGCGEPWDALSYFPYPRPLRVLTHAADGTPSGFSPHAASSTALVTGPHSIPSAVPATRHPYASNQVSGFPGTTDETG